MRAPVFDEEADLGQRAKPVAVEAVIAEGAVRRTKLLTLLVYSAAKLMKRLASPSVETVFHKEHIWLRLVREGHQKGDR